jgi:hypothetical protein
MRINDNFLLRRGVLSWWRFIINAREADRCRKAMEKRPTNFAGWRWGFGVNPRRTFSAPIIRVIRCQRVVRPQWRLRDLLWTGGCPRQAGVCLRDKTVIANPKGEAIQYGDR